MAEQEWNDELQVIVTATTTVIVTVTVSVTTTVSVTAAIRASLSITLIVTPSVIDNKTTRCRYRASMESGLKLCTGLVPKGDIVNGACEWNGGECKYTLHVYGGKYGSHGVVFHRM